MIPRGDVPLRNPVPWMRLCLLLLLAGTPARGADALRLAVIPDNPSLRPAADLLTVTLSTNAGVQLVERDQLDKLLREQALAGARDAVKLGQLLGADGLVLLQVVRREDRDLLAARLIAVNPGITLDIETAPWPLTNAAIWAPHVVPRLAVFFPKLQVPPKDAISLSVLNLRSAVKTSASEALERDLTLLLSHRLTRERELFVLERQHLAAALFEKELQQEQQSPFWTGRYLVDGVLDKDGFDQDRLTISARLVAAAGGASIPVEVTGDRKQPAALVEQLAVKLLAALHRAPTGAAWDPAREAGQYLAEAQWAFRWQLWPEAQQAADSAWALGLRTAEVAALRIRASGERAIGVDYHFGNIVFPAAPEPAKLKAATQAAELFFENAPMVFSRESPTNFEWVDIGTRALVQVTALLDGFYHAAELRPGSEDLLQAARAAARNAASALEMNFPKSTYDLIIKTNYTLRQVIQRLELVEWNEAGVWFDRPEDSLPVYRAMLERGFHQANLPRIVGWSWADRKRVPALFRRFVESLRGSTNASVRLEGAYLALELDPAGDEDHFHALEADVSLTLWENRQRLLTDPESFTVLPRVMVALRDKYNYIYGDTFDRGSWAELYPRMRKEYLTIATNWTAEIWEGLFPGGGARLPAAERPELAALAAQFKQRVNLQGYPARVVDGTMRNLGAAGTAANPAENPSVQGGQIAFEKFFPELASPAGSVQAVGFIPWIHESERQLAGFHPVIARVLSRRGALWAMIRVRPDNFMEQRRDPNWFVKVNLETGRCDEISFPIELGMPENNFEVTARSLFVSMSDHLQRYDFATRTWNKVPVPFEDGARLFAVGEKLFIQSPEAIFQVDLGSYAITVLGSSRRRPAVNELDELWNPGSRPYSFLWPDGAPGLQLDRQVFAWEGEPAKWSKAALLRTNQYGHMTPFVSSGGLGLIVANSATGDYLAEFRRHGTESELLCYKSPPYRSTNSAARVNAGEPRWDWPDPFLLDYSCISLDQTGLWSWQPRRIGQHPGSRAIEPLIFTDDRNATILRFEPGRRRALPLPVRYEKDGRPYNPFEATNNSYMGLPVGMMIPEPFCLNFTNGLVTICAFDRPGHWLIPHPALESRLKILREKLPDNSPPTGATKR